jgi:nitrite reductase/ring-hydroxylating ferredoxin subunit
MKKNSSAWQFLCNQDEIPDESCKGLELDGQKIFAVKKQGKLFLYRNACPHLGIPLEWVEDQFLDSSGSMIQCANHGALFVVESGHCVSGPCAGRKLQSLDFKIENNTLLIAGNCPEN